MKPVTWGVISTADIGLKRVIPAMQQGAHCTIAAIASRDLGRAQSAANDLGISKAYGSYEALLADPDIEAIYNPLPNHLHLEWSARALEAGKHVLCEKPITLNAEEARRLIAVRDRTGGKIEEAFMVRNHPQWWRVRQLIHDGSIGELRAFQCAYTYHNTDPADIRNNPETGGGGLYDLGGYTSTIARFVFEAEPVRALALINRDPTFGTDRLTAAILAFPNGHASFTVATQTARYQHAEILGSHGWIRADMPFAHPEPMSCRLFIGNDKCVGALHTQTIEFEPVNQYTLQGDRFSRLVRGDDVMHWPLETALGNMRVLDALFRSADSGRWEDV